MKTFKKVMAVALSAAMVASMSTSVFAEAPTTTAGEANVLAFSAEAYVVPTTLKIALNPGGYTVIKTYKKTTDTAVNTSKTYYTFASNKYTKVASPAVADIATYYEADSTSTDKVISFNYGIVNKSTVAKDVKISLEASYTPAANKEAIEFVDAETFATPKTTANPLGAESDEMKMYLGVATVNATGITGVDTYYFKTKDTAIDTGKKYYTVSSGVYSEVTSPAVADIGTYYEQSSAMGTQVTADALGNVAMTAATTGVAPFVKGTSKTTAEVNCIMTKATYNVKSGENIDFSTTQTALADKIEITELGTTGSGSTLKTTGVTGFTIVGNLNDEADWTKADATAINIAPTYEFTDVNDKEANRAISGTLNQFGTNSTITLNSSTKDVTISVTGTVADAETLVGMPSVKMTGLKDGVIETWETIDNIGEYDLENYTLEKSGAFTCKIPATSVGYYDANTKCLITVKFSDGTVNTALITTPAAS